MAFPPVVVADADVLFGATTRGLLIQLDYAGLLHLHWSPLILDEMSRALVKSGRKLDFASAKAHEALIVVYDGVPRGVSTADNEVGTRMSLAKLAALVEVD